MTTTAGTSAAGPPPPPELPRVQFPLPPPYWDHPGEQPDFRTWWMRYDNYVYWIDAQRGPDHPLSDEYKTRLLFSLLGSEGTSRFASNPLVCQLATASFVEFSADV
ncbi:MAG: hypothetical protein GY832_26865, partial [Chloroflexi bacterium]|nr:hypothetical protein [Chloroflexota bacterium]